MNLNKEVLSWDHEGIQADSIMLIWCQLNKEKEKVCGLVFVCMYDLFFVPCLRQRFICVTELANYYMQHVRQMDDRVKFSCENFKIAGVI